MDRVLLVACRTATGVPLLEAVRRRAALSPCRFTLLVPRPCHGLHKVVDPEDHGWGDSRQRAPVLGHFAQHDEWEPAEEVSSLEDDLRHAGRPVRFEVYPRVGHWFAEVDRPEAYDPAAASLALRRTAAFLRSQLRGDAAAQPEL